MDAREFGGALAWKDRARGALATSRRRLLDLLRPIYARQAAPGDVHSCFGLPPLALPDPKTCVQSGCS
jgi:hypothetical protein